MLASLGRSFPAVVSRVGGLHNAPFGVDLLLPQVGGNARKTNYDYTDGQLDELLDVIINGKAALSVSAVGVPPKAAVDELHAPGIPVMNMVGHPKHVSKALAEGVDIVCAQGSEGGGHTGEIPFSALILAVVDLYKSARSSLTGEPSLAPPKRKEHVLMAGYDNTVRTLIYSGRPMSVRKTPYVAEWEPHRQREIETLVSQGKIPHEVELEKQPDKSLEGRMWLMGNVVGSINMISQAASSLKVASNLMLPKARL
ncbi:inosine monophosphate dehydrogenase [Imleria badia]|nr:inosine monophosphate dehydrogenase [Imleria badia]